MMGALFSVTTTGWSTRLDRLGNFGGNLGWREEDGVGRFWPVRWLSPSDRRIPRHNSAGIEPRAQSFRLAGRSFPECHYVLSVALRR